MKKYVKVFIIVFIVLILYSLMVGAIAKNREKKKKEETPVVKPTNNTNSDENKKYDMNVILLPNTILGYSGGLWEENPSYDYENVNFSVYSDQTLERVKLVNTDRWHIVEANGNFVDYTSDFIAIKSDIPYEAHKLLPSNELSVANETTIKDFLDSQNIKYNYDSLNKKVYSFDVNHDGIRDEIYVVSNVFIENFLGFDNTFAYVFVRTLNQNVVLYEKVINAINAMNTCNPDLQGIIIVDNNPFEIIECTFASESGTKHLIYSVLEKSAINELETEAN